MNKEPNAFFFETRQISDNSIIFEELEKRELFFSYFQIDQKYYLFFYAEKSTEIDFLYQFVDVFQELNSKKRQIRSLRAFFLYALEIMEVGNEIEILSANLQPFFGEKLKLLFGKIKKELFLSFYLDHRTVEALVQLLT
jgi:hypothetical protein